MRQRLKPYLQGDLDALCGPYSVINALRIVHGNLGKTKCKELLAKCGSLLEENGRSIGVLRNGVYLWGMCFLMREVVQVDYPVKVHRPFARKAKIPLNTLWERMSGFLGEGQEYRAIILALQTPFIDHWSVAWRVSQSALYLCDSDRLKRFQRKRFGVAGVDEDRPNTLFPAYMFFLERRE